MSRDRHQAGEPDLRWSFEKDWKQPTKMEWVQTGLEALKQVIRDKKIRSIAIPPLGCGNGGLDWAVVRPVIESALRDLSDVDVVVYKPTSK